jgi:hypothetical protein
MTIRVQGSNFNQTTYARRASTKLQLVRNYKACHTKFRMKQFNHFH